MKYKPTYGDKQRDAQKLRKNEELQNRRVQVVTSQDESKKRENPPDEKKRVA